MPTASRTCAAAVAFALLNCVSTAHASDTKSHLGQLKLQPLGTYDAGTAGSAEIVAYDATSKRLFLVNAATATVDILDVRDPSSPTLVATIDTSELGSPNSVAVGRGVVAVAIESTPKTNAGHVAFYTTNGELIEAVTVGALPDMVTFTPDTYFVLTANEGEPSGYGAGQVDPEGSVSIIPVPWDANGWRKLTDAAVRTVSFAQFNGQEAALREQGIRITVPARAPGRTSSPSTSRSLLIRAPRM